MTRTNTDLAEWLARHGLGEYAQAFAENNIEYSVLPDLTENDLKQIGVSSLGHRKKLLRAIEALTASGQLGGATLVGSRVAAASPSVAQHREPEFRQITVLFSDLVASTQLSEKLDPEDLQKLIDAYREECSTAIGRYGGEVARYFGDGVMAFFGWPSAHEDDAIRAVHAALEIASGVPKISGPVPLSCRVGVCSGPVVVGDIGDSGRWSMDAVGETPNIAARLQALAAPDTVLISETTRRLISAAFDFQDLGIQELKGVTQPVHLYRVLAAKYTVSRFEAAHAGSLTPLIGRSSELSLLLDRWQKVKEGDGQVILLSGIPGVGKSRLLHELKSHIQQEPHILLHHQCSPYHNQSAFFPVIEQIQHLAQITAREPDADKLAKLRAYLPDNSTGPVLLVARLLSIPVHDHLQLSGLTPQQIKNRTISTLVDMLLAFSVQGPTLCIFEDAHWLDPSTVELLDLIISRIGHARVLLVVSCRPEFRPAWITHANISVHSLTRLSQAEVKAMIRGLLRGGRMPQPLLDQIIEKADGVPLYIEELTNSMLSAPVLGRGASERTAQAALLRVPDTLSDALMERLDRVAPSRKLAMIAAVIGREFSYDLLSAVSQLDEDKMLTALSLLEQADIVYRVDISPSLRFAFKHVLLRDAIYDSLLRSKKQQIHAEIATVLEHQFPELAENQTEVLAYHHQEAGNHSAAIRYWFKSGQRALAHSANIEAIASFRSALELLKTLPETPERTKQETEVQLALGIPLIAVKGYASTETREAFSRARALCLRLGDIPEYFQALFGLWGHSWMGGRNDEALSMADEFLLRSRDLSDPVLAMVAHRVMGSTLLTIGDFQSSANHFEETIRLSISEGRQPLHQLYVVEPQAASLLLQSWDLWFLGYPDRALSRVSEALALAQDLAHPYTVAFAHYMTSVVHLLRGDAARALENAQSSFEMSQEQRFSLYAILSRISRGRAVGELGRIEEARSDIALGIDEARQNGVGFMLPMMNSWLAEIDAKVGENERALSLIEGLLAGVGDVTGRAWESELHRQKAQILLSLVPSKVGDAESHLRRSIEVARGQSAKSLELRAATSLAELWRRQGRIDEARTLLEPICDWFDEGTETADLKRARDCRRALH
ncbi:AAA family ATPase [Bradyrhizobium sp. 180]|uniref:adenylate/guanylate cyclase domain-containing protein n=1 Tax=unclassified Bradyrhizobium TaxID=2631580 RepID=UPI001FF8DB82|nr:MULTISPECIES: adenylate/guanylate cyclase domain-containing protein [unclassified Bradyrhizobium]MCK1423251.1 AAA family ATPase [Bradyrhizobium sp. CW12]MCK1493070.1 AAA family ATPase [Bradyrhizobium sp. 180]MCK1531374.1 AAA family ATPase [Bradyrhizobium sp. 182]MCK1599237.1 AAA family ATPase [Bradyrhizobium sp. 164]MCK1645185.1 AAA family ATPase [Bradyrhizobium sp. 154]